MKKTGTITKISLFVITALVVLIVSFPHIVNATEVSQNQDSETISTENKASQKEKTIPPASQSPENRPEIKIHQSGICFDRMCIWFLR